MEFEQLGPFGWIRNVQADLEAKVILLKQAQQSAQIGTGPMVR
jgi:hypothetical protein